MTSNNHNTIAHLTDAAHAVVRLVSVVLAVKSVYSLLIGLLLAQLKGAGLVRVVNA
jgi:hypothetical protein